MLKDMPEELQENALEDDALEQVAGGAGAKRDFVEREGVVVAALPNAMFEVDMGNGQTIRAHISGKLRMNYIRIQPGDRVMVEFSPEDPSKGRVTYVCR